MLVTTDRKMLKKSSLRLVMEEIMSLKIKIVASLQLKRRLKEPAIFPST